MKKTLLYLCIAGMFASSVNAQQFVYRAQGGKTALPEIQAGTAASGTGSGDSAGNTGETPTDTGSGSTDDSAPDNTEAEDEAPKEPITWTYSPIAWGGNTNYNTQEEAMRAVDGDTATRTDTFLANYGGAIRARYYLDRPVTGTFTVRWRHAVGDGYGNLGGFSVSCLVNGAWSHLFNNSSMYSNASLTPAVSSGHFDGCSVVSVYTDDIGKGYTFFAIDEIIVDED